MTGIKTEVYNNFTQIFLFIMEMKVNNNDTLWTCKVNHISVSNKYINIKTLILV